jgi:membrane-bound ClpP family serine protease
MMVVISPTIGVILILIGIAFFIVDLSATKHGLPSGMLLGAVVVVAMLMGACFSGSWVRCAPSEGGPSLPARRE